MSISGNRYILAILLMTGIFILIDLSLGRILNKRSVNAFRIKNNYYHHGLLNSLEGRGIWGKSTYPVLINQYGFRDTTIQTSPLDNSEKNILIIGDSHSEGVGLSYEQCFPVFLDKDLRETGIFNASAVSYSPRLYYLKVKHLIEQQGFIPDELLVMVDISDIQNEIIYENFIPSSSFSANIKNEMNRFFHRNSFIYYRIKNIVQQGKLKRFIKESEIFEEYIRKSKFDETFGVYSGFFDRFDDHMLVSDPDFHNVGYWMYNKSYHSLMMKGLQNGKENIFRLKNLCDRHDIKMYLSVHPWKAQIAMGDTSDVYTEFWRKTCKENNIHFINLYPAFIHPAVHLSFGGGFFIPNDNHWNENGHRIVAKALAEEFHKEGTCK